MCVWKLRNSWQHKCKSLGQNHGVWLEFVSQRSISRRTKKCSGPLFSSSNNRFWPHASWSFPVAFPMGASPESFCPWRAKCIYSKKTEPQQEKFLPCSRRKQEKIGNKWHQQNRSFSIFNWESLSSIFFSTMLPRANAAWPVLETYHRLPNVAGRYQRPPNTRYKDQTTWAKHSQKVPHSPGDCDDFIVKAVGEWKILKWKSQNSYPKISRSQS